MARYGEAFFGKGDRKIVLNFALAEGAPIDPEILLRHFSPETFLDQDHPRQPDLCGDQEQPYLVRPTGSDGVHARAGASVGRLRG